MNRIWLFILFLCITCIGKSQNSLFQYSLFNILAGGEFDGQMKVSDLLEKGNTGLGTFNSLYGELILNEGVCYRAKADTSAGVQLEKAKQSDSIPFAVVVNFSTDTTININTASRKYIDSIISSHMPSNTIAALKLSANFKSIRYRSVVKQNKPYRVLSEAVKSQKVFESKDINGTLVGFYFPSYMKELNVEGFHWHFISGDKNRGGHLLDFSAEQIELKIDYIYNYELKIPEANTLNTKAFKPSEKEIEYIEKAK